MLTTQSDVFRVLICCIRQVVPELEAHPFQACDSLEDLGANSLDRAEIITLWLEALRLDMPRRQLIGARTLGDLVDLLHEKLRAG
jgi:polyketide biosynthesis acyl carrier protein